MALDIGGLRLAVFAQFAKPEPGQRIRTDSKAFVAVLLAAPRGLARCEFQEIFGCSKSHVDRIVRRLMTEGLVEQAGVNAQYTKLYGLTERGRKVGHSYIAPEGSVLWQTMAWAVTKPAPSRISVVRALFGARPKDWLTYRRLFELSGLRPEHVFAVRVAIQIGLSEGLVEQRESQDGLVLRLTPIGRKVTKVFLRDFPDGP